MIILDTHIWIWWVSQSDRLTEGLQDVIRLHQAQGLGVSVFSCWEVAKLVEKGRLELTCSVQEWLESALAYPGVQRLDLTLPIIIQSTQLEGFHHDPADQIIVATAQIHRCPLLTVDAKIMNYPQVQVLQA